MSDSKRPDDDDAVDRDDSPSVDEQADAARRDAASEDDEDEQIDLDDLDRMGVDGLVEEMGGAPKSPRRPAWLAGVVFVLALGLLWWMYSDFRFWTQPAEPVQLGSITEWMVDGEVPSGWADTHVAIDGTPNVKWAMLTNPEKGERRSFFDLVEAQGQLFVLTRQVSGEHETRRYPGHFEGRLVRIDKATMTRMAQLYAQENVTRAVDISTAALADARRDDSLAFTTEREGVVELAPEDRIRLVVRAEDARVMLGGLSFRNGEEAEAAVAALGYPYHRLPDLVAPADPRKALGGAQGGEPSKPGRADAFRFVVRIPQGEHEAAKAALESKMIGPANPADHRQGVSVYARAATYFAPAGAVRVDGDNVVFPFDDNDAAPGYDVKDGKLVEKRLPDGMLRVPLASLHEVRLEVPIVVDEGGYILRDGERPKDKLYVGLAFLMVLVIAMANALWLVMGVLRRKRA